ncbi:DUF5326 family protein [Streptomyces sp. NBC_01803]|uniref:DUF5326 family protein n=1 Tax=Streptomyces sp. NBC_01803 TaxID=2975946 RepID=UPI002DD977F4|nr:DUF5326 family protein [Streptomyces sp. NBC_01803]WSA45252.1 DUF5326 family protein [Streptomyces sp. NBC_01803]
MKEAFKTLPWWLRWVALPAVALVVFGVLLIGVVTWLVAVLFRLLLIVALVAGLIFLVRKITSSSSSSGGGW